MTHSEASQLIARLQKLCFEQGKEMSLIGWLEALLIMSMSSPNQSTADFAAKFISDKIKELESKNQ